MSLTLRYSIVFSGADRGIKHRGPKTILGAPSNVTSPLWMPWLFRVTEGRGVIVIATRGGHLTDLSDFYLADVRRPRVVGMEWGSTHVRVVSEDD